MMQYVEPVGAQVLAARGRRVVVLHLPDLGEDWTRLVRASEAGADYVYRWGAYAGDLVGIELQWPQAGVALGILFRLSGQLGVLWRAVIRAIQEGAHLALAPSLPAVGRMASAIWLTDVTRDVGWLRV